jgi:hypothetical protein
VPLHPLTVRRVGHHDGAPSLGGRKGVNRREAPNAACRSRLPPDTSAGYGSGAPGGAFNETLSRAIMSPAPP